MNDSSPNLLILQVVIDIGCESLCSIYQLNFRRLCIRKKKLLGTKLWFMVSEILSEIWNAFFMDNGKHILVLIYVRNLSTIDESR